MVLPSRVVKILLYHGWVSFCLVECVLQVEPRPVPQIVDANPARDPLA